MLRRRRSFAVLFAVGVALAVGFGCLLAAYDLWGGVPRALWPLARRLFIGAGFAIVTGAIGWVTSWPKHERMVASLRAAAILAGVAAVSGAALWTHYAVRWKTSRLVCAPALVAPTRAAREAALREGLGPLFPVIDPHSSCLRLVREMRELDASGACPTFVMDDVACRCGKERWTPASPKRCATPSAAGTRSEPTACAYRAELRESTLGCAEPGDATLEEARRAASGR